jgi:zf-MYND-like zinc finger, mRNA-binding
MKSSHGLINTEGTVFAKDFLTDTSFTCVVCNKNNALYSCQICLKLGINHVRFCSEACFGKNWTDHKQIHSSVSSRAKTLSEEHSIASSEVANTKNVSSAQVKRLKQLSSEIELFRLRIQVFDMQSKLCQSEDELKDKVIEANRLKELASTLRGKSEVKLSDNAVTTQKELDAKQAGFQVINYLFSLSSVPHNCKY